MAVSSNKIIFGTAMGISQETIYSRYLPCIRHIFEAYVRECPHKIWPYMVITEPPFLDPEFPVDSCK
jgi:hypothetical protein